MNNSQFCTFASTFQPVTSRDWEIHLHFAVHGSGDTLFGDGFAFFYARDTMEMGKLRVENIHSLRVIMIVQVKDNK